VCLICRDGSQNLTEWDTVDPPRGGAGDVDCASLHPFPSMKMDTFSRIALHEITHYSSVGPATSLVQQIKDRTNEDKESTYDLPRVHNLVDSKQDNNPVVTNINVDSYTWISLDAWISRKCSRDSTGNNWALFFTQDSSPYEHVR